MKSNALINVESLRNLERGILIVGSIVLASSAILLFSTGLTHFQHLEAKSKLALTAQEIHSLTETINKSKLVKFSSNSKKELNVVQAAMDQIAAENHCQLQEVTSTNDTIPLVTRYKTGQEDKNWKQLAMSTQVVGSLKNVMSFVRGLSMISVPIELSGIDISPISTDGETKVSAKVAFQILKQESTR